MGRLSEEEMQAYAKQQMTQFGALGSSPSEPLTDEERQTFADQVNYDALLSTTLAAEGAEAEGDGGALGGPRAPLGVVQDHAGSPAQALLAPGQAMELARAFLDRWKEEGATCR